VFQASAPSSGRGESGRGTGLTSSRDGGLKSPLEPEPQVHTQHTLSLSPASRMSRVMPTRLGKCSVGPSYYITCVRSLSLAYSSYYVGHKQKLERCVYRCFCIDVWFSVAWYTGSTVISRYQNIMIPTFLNTVVPFHLIYNQPFQPYRFKNLLGPVRKCL
jgi:hypothetical protein